MELAPNTKDAFRESLYARALQQSQTSFFSYVKFMAPTLVDDFKVEVDNAAELSGLNSAGQG